MTCAVEHISADRIDAVWPAIEHVIDRAMKASGGWASTDRILGDIRSGMMQCFVVSCDGVLKSVVATSLEEDASGKRIRITLMSGDDMEQWLPTLTAAMQEWKRQLGYDAIITEGRPGWAKALKKIGARQVAVVMEL